jgi:carboxyl-terminal processing protease
MVSQHYKADFMDDLEKEMAQPAFTQRIVENFLASVDPDKVLFYQNEYQEWLEKRPRGSNYLDDPQICQYFHRLSKALNSNLKERTQIIDEAIEQPIPPQLIASLKEQIVPQKDVPEDVLKSLKTYPINRQELEKKVHTSLAITYLALIAEGEPTESAFVVTQRIFRNRDFQAPTQDTGTIYESMANAILSSLDKHSRFLNQQQFAELMVEIQAGQVGVGVVPAPSLHGLRILSLVEGSPAQKSGKLKVGDIITAIDGAPKPVLGSVEQSSSAFQGAKDSEILLDIYRPGEGNMQVTLKRGIISQTNQALTPQVQVVSGKKIAYLNISIFFQKSKEMGGLTDQLALIYKDLNQKDVDGLLIDLRENDGGVLNEVTRTLEKLVPRGPLLTLNEAGGEMIAIKDGDNGEIQWDRPLGILVGPKTASAAEIMAGVLKEFNRVVIFGESETYGKGSIQSVVPIDGGMNALFKGATIITNGFYHLPSGQAVQGTGVTPQILLPSESPLKISKEKDNNPQLQAPTPALNLFEMMASNGEQISKWTPDEEYQKALETLRNNQKTLNPTLAQREQALTLMAGWVDLISQPNPKQTDLNRLVKINEDETAHNLNLIADDK